MSKLTCRLKHIAASEVYLFTLVMLSDRRSRGAYPIISLAKLVRDRIRLCGIEKSVNYRTYGFVKLEIRYLEWCNKETDLTML